VNSSESIAAEIQQLEEQLAPLQVQLDAEMRAFASALPPSAAKWIEAEVRRRIEEHADHINQMGIDATRQLKADVNSLIERLPELCEKAIQHEKKWPHNDLAEPEPSARTPSGGAFFDGAFRSVINHLGEVLGKYGLVSGRPGYSSSWERVEGGQFRYTHSPGFDSRTIPAAVEYGKHLSGQAALRKQLKEKRDELSKAKARELWDSA
jgi:hypothetical protein